MNYNFKKKCHYIPPDSKIVSAQFTKTQLSSNTCFWPFTFTVKTALV